ncbi:hypothetical protein H4O18_01205 [Arenibacter sp. BSSL-BM3]|uniref:Uncharacterized protein n=1 Tax=Arenibacter arenosicollis TaxID=2762274 RepID=A0ABR7QHD0_9FLAO|nr:hypothetical protein [Arenibacter arenosicollis]MBC8766598.1 hypothetical protein [Arenibacter arenosicollis]
MTKNYIHIILFLCCSLLWASPALASFENLGDSNIEVLLRSKDSLLPKAKDTTKLKKADPNYLAHLQQIAMARMGNADEKSVFPIPTWPERSRRHNSSIAITEEEKTFRSFPSLDQKLAQKEDFNVSFANLKPEFTPEYISTNFSRNPKADTLVAQAIRAFETVQELGNFVDIITGKELLELPVGLTKKDSTSGNRVELAITQVKFTPQYAEFKAWAKMIIPVKGPNGEPSREIYFGGEGIKLSHDGALLGDMKLVMLGDQAIPLNGDNWLLTLKGGIDLKNGAFGDQSFIEFDCVGLKSIGLEADLRISRNILLPITSGGNYVCGESTDNKYLKDSDVVNNKCYVGASFSIKANGWNDLLVDVSLPQFEVRGLKGWGFNIKQVVLDLSDSRNASGIKFPKNYSEVLVHGERNLWRGFYAKELSIMLPKGIENTKTSNKRVQFGAENLILDSQGVSGSFFAENILKVGEGSAGKWAFTIADVSLSLSRNSLTGGSIAGDIAVPIFEKPMDYTGYIQQDGYGLAVGLNSHYKTPVFLGEMQLEKNSSVAIDIKDGNVYPSANLSGQLSIVGKIGQKEGEESPSAETATNSGNGFNFPGIVFEGLKLETELGKKPISAKSFGFEGEMKLMNFPASVEKLELVTSSNQVGLSFDLKINLDGEGSHATTSMQVMGKLEDGAKIQKWQFERVKVNGIDIDYEKSGITLNGGLEIMEDHSWYGDGFRGNVTATIKSVNLKVEGKAIFGVKDFRYWNVDVWAKNDEKSSTKFMINSMVGGISYRMKKIRGNEDGFSPSSAVYRPNLDYGLSVRAGVDISTQNSDTFSGKAYLDMAFNSHGGLNRIGFTGEGAFMGDKTSGGLDSSDFGALNKTFEKVNDFVEENKGIADQLSKYGNFMGLAKESIPVHDVAASGKVGVYVGIEKDFVNQTFDGEFELYLDLEGVKGGGENNLAGYAKMHTGPEDWYIYIGTPQKRIELLFQVGVQLRIGGYFMTGTQLPSQLDPHPMVVKILGDDMLNSNRQENQLQSGKGFAFGLNFGYGYNLDYLIFYAFVELGAGFDVMHAYYPNAKCVGRPGPIGNNGWYSRGQVYAYLYGEFGVKVDLAFINGKFPIAEAGVAAMLRGQFPNPAYFQGYVGMYYKILGGLVSGRMRLKVEVGEECELENINNAVGVPMISDVTPKDNSDDISVFTAPQAVFNYAANSDFKVELDDGVRTFKLQLKNFAVTSEGEQLKGELKWNDTNDAVTFKPNETLPSEKEVKVVVEVSFDEKIGGSYQTMVENGKPVIEKKEITFKTDRAPDYIPLENIAYMYPVIDQQSFYPEEYDKGYVKMKTPQNYLFDSGFETRAEFFSTTSNQGTRTNLTYDRSKATVIYEVPEGMSLNSNYKLNLLAFPPGSDIKTKIIVENTETLADQESGDTNWFDPSTGNQDTRNVSGSAVVSNKKAANITISNGTPKSILDYGFKTSKHPSFKDKVKELTVTNNLLNYIFADVHSLSVKVADYEYLEKLEVLGGKYTNSKPLVYPQAILDDSYYKKKIYPLLYENYPLDGNIRVNRDEALLGLPPVRSFYIGNEYLANLENNPNSSWVKNRIPFVYNLPYQYKVDMVYLRDKILNRYYGSDGNISQHERYKYLIESSFPPLPLGSFKAQLIYRTPGDIYQKGYEIKYVND